MTIHDLVGATILRTYQLGGGGIIIVTDRGTFSAIGVSKTEVEPAQFSTKETIVIN